jgi:hypothetical protein
MVRASPERRILSGPLRCFVFRVRNRDARHDGLGGNGPCGWERAFALEGCGLRPRP